MSFLEPLRCRADECSLAMPVLHWLAGLGPRVVGLLLGPSLVPQPQRGAFSRHAQDADLAALTAAGQGGVPLVRLRWRCGNCGSRLTEFIVGGSHMRPRGTRPS